MIPVTVTIGIGMRTVTCDTTLVACPHVGDLVTVGGVTVTADEVAIGADRVYVRETVRFASEQQLDEYVALGWSR
jgi:hypothetical protein